MGRISTRQSCNRVTNMAWSMLIVAPMVVMFWRGIWDLMNQMKNKIPRGRRNLV